MNGGCTHLDQIDDATPSSWGCEDCLAQVRRDWVTYGAARSADTSAAATTHSEDMPPATFDRQHTS
jgi:hypothetical protein